MNKIRTFSPFTLIVTFVCLSLVGLALMPLLPVKLSPSRTLPGAKPLSINVDTYGTGVVDDAKLATIVSEVFDFRPAAIVETLQLKRPVGWSYQQTAAYGHFGRDQFPWEKTDRTEDLRKAAGVN